jgi:hypothetical protein
VQGKSGVVIEEMLRQRFERLTSSAAMQPKVELALQTVRMYNSFAEGELQLPKDLQSKKGGACVMFATHVAEILLQAEYVREREREIAGARPRPETYWGAPPTYSPSALARAQRILDGAPPTYHPSALAGT